MGAVARGTVEGPLNGHDVGIGYRLTQVLNHDVEGLVWMVNNDVLVAHGRETIAIEFGGCALENGCQMA